MEQGSGSSLLVDIVHAGVVAENETVLLKHVLPPLRELTGAEGVVVLVAGGDGPRVSAADGVDLPAVDLEAPSGTARALVPVPEAWLGGGVTAVLVQRLAGHLGTLAVAWITIPTYDEALVGAALDAIAGATDRLHATTELHDLALRVDNAQQLAGMGDYDWHIASDTNRWSDQLYRIYGHEPQSFNASYERFLAAIHPDDRERIQSIHQQAYGTGEPYQMIERIVRPDGELRYLSSNGEVIMDEAGTPVRMRGTCIDVTDRILAEQEQERVHELFRGLVEAAPDAILVCDDQGRVVQCNEGAIRLLGGDPTGRQAVEILPEGVTAGQAMPALSLSGSELLLDVVTSDLAETVHSPRTAAFLHDARPRLEREAMATRFGELQQRRRQALEINDNVVQGLSAALYCMDAEDLAGAELAMRKTLGAARNMMDDLLEPSGQQLGPGDLVRSTPTVIGATGADAGDVETRTEPAPGGTIAVNHRILVADDAEDIRMLIRLKLSRETGYEVVGEAVDGVDAVEQARSTQPDLVVLDMAMPRMDGLQALPLIRDAVPGVRVVVLSGFNQSTLEQEALAAGADRYLVKGGPMSELLEAITDVLDPS